MTILIAHRGDRISFQENTLEAFLSAFEKGADGIELDVHLHDGRVIIVHDFLFDQSKKYPELQDVLEQIHLKGRIEIEIKEFSSDILIPLKKILEKFPEADFEITTSEIPLAPHIKECFPKILLGLIFQESLFSDWMTQDVVQRKLIGWAKLAKVDTLHIPLSVLNKFGKGSLVEALHKAGFIVHSHIFNTERQEKDYSDLVQWKVDQCTFDNIGLIEHKKNLNCQE